MTPDERDWLTFEASCGLRGDFVICGDAAPETPGGRCSRPSGHYGVHVAIVPFNAEGAVQVTAWPAREEVH